MGWVSAVSRNMGWMLTNGGTRAAMGVALAGILARYLGPDDYGWYSLAMAIVSLSFFVSDAGLNDLSQREILRSRPDEVGVVMGTTFVIRLAGSSVVGLALVTVVRSLISSPLAASLVAVLALVHVVRPLGVLAGWFESQLKSRVVAIGSILGGGIHLALVALSVWLGRPSAASLMLMRVADAILFGVALLVAYRLHGHSPLLWRFSARRARSMLRESRWLVFTGLFGVLNLRIDQVMIASLGTPSDLGYYAAAAKVAESWEMIPFALSASLFPRLVGDGERGVLQRSLSPLLASVIWLGLGIAACLWIFAPIVVTGLFGESFLPAAGVLTVLSWSGVFLGLRTVLVRWILVNGRPEVAVWATAAGAVVNVGTNLLVIPAFGAVGAAWATLLSYAAANFLALLIPSSTRAFGRAVAVAFVRPDVAVTSLRRVLAEWRPPDD